MATTQTIVAALEPRNVQTIAEIGPKVIASNIQSHDRCLAAGQALLEKASQGMSEELDKAIALFLVKAKKTVKLLNEQRSPITQMFDVVRSGFTNLENDIDPGKKGSISYNLQAKRNEYAAKKHAEAEAQRKEEAARIAKENAISVFKSNVNNWYLSTFNTLLNNGLNQINALFQELTLENESQIRSEIAKISTTFNIDLLKGRPLVMIPVELNKDEVNAISQEVLDSLQDRFSEEYRFEIEDMKSTILDRLPSKMKELKLIAQADEEEAKLKKAQMEERDRQIGREKEMERKKLEEQAKTQALLNAQKRDIDAAFDAELATEKMPTCAYIPAVSKKKRIAVIEKDGFMEVVSLWWIHKGKQMSMEELESVFSKQLTFANKLANDKANPILITSDNVDYVDEIKAK